MKLLAVSTAALAFIAVPALAVSNFDKCADKAPEVVAAISQYCTKLGTKNVIPNANAGAGWTSSYEGKHARVAMIGADCKPGQWVPKEYCFSQFYQMCANGDAKGQRAAHFGRGGCQRWYINNNTPSGRGLGG